MSGQINQKILHCMWKCYCTHRSLEKREQKVMSFGDARGKTPSLIGALKLLCKKQTTIAFFFFYKPAVELDCYLLLISNRTWGQNSREKARVDDIVCVCACLRVKKHDLTYSIWNGLLYFACYLSKLGSAAIFSCITCFLSVGLFGFFMSKSSLDLFLMKICSITHIL